MNSDSAQQRAIVMSTAVITSNVYFSTNRVRGHELDSKGTGWGQVPVPYEHGNDPPHSAQGKEFLHLVTRLYSSFRGLSLKLVLVGWSVSIQSVSWFKKKKHGEFLHQLCHYQRSKVESAPQRTVVI
jgi:hypothetical protein